MDKIFKVSMGWSHLPRLARLPTINIYNLGCDNQKIIYFAQGARVGIDGSSSFAQGARVGLMSLLLLAQGALVGGIGLVPEVPTLNVSVGAVRSVCEGFHVAVMTKQKEWR